MIQNRASKQQNQRSQSPFTFNLNLKKNFKPLSEIRRSPNTQRNILKSSISNRSPSTSHQKLKLISKQNPQPYSETPLKLSFRNSSSTLKEVSSLKSNANKLSSLKAYKEAFISSLVQPFSTEQVKKVSEQKIKEKDFEKIKELGRGKFGVVWMARHKVTNFLCALKIISKKVVKEQKMEHQLAKEIRIHNRLKHQNIISYYGFFADEESFFIITEFATQGHVFDKLKKHHRLEEGEVKEIARQTADGLRIIHNMGYVHRDIKPQNILIQFGVVKICDFGWIAQCQGNQMRKSQCGTPLYYSPQIVKKEPHNTQIDVWSLGLLAYEMIVGRVPFKIWSQFDLHVILEQQVNIPDYVDATQHLKDFVCKCLIKDQKQRPLLNDLRQHKFINEGMLRVQSINGLYGEVKAIF